MAKWRRLASKADYKKAIDRINELMDHTRADAVQNELTLLSYLVEEYEEQHFPIPDASAQEVMKFAMEMKGIRQKDLIPVLGTKGNVSKILNGAAKIQVDMLGPLSSLLGIPVESLIPKMKVERNLKPIEPRTKTAVAEPSAEYKKRKK